MILTFKSKALKRYFEDNDPRGLRVDWVSKIKIILSALNNAKQPQSLNLPGLSFHELKGNMSGRYAVSVSKNWRITFAFQDGDAEDVDLEDYHG
jgi:toxin HigB-1